MPRHIAEPDLLPDSLVLRYTAPVYVTVDLQQRRVVSVEIADTEVELDRAADAPIVIDGEGDPQAAAHIAEHADWPAWKFI